MLDDDREVSIRASDSGVRTLPTVNDREEKKIGQSAGICERQRLRRRHQTNVPAQRQRLPFPRRGSTDSHQQIHSGLVGRAGLTQLQIQELRQIKCAD